MSEEDLYRPTHQERRLIATVLRERALRYRSISQEGIMFGSSAPTQDALALHYAGLTALADLIERGTTDEIALQWIVSVEQEDGTPASSDEQVGAPGCDDAKGLP